MYLGYPDSKNFVSVLVYMALVWGDRAFAFRSSVGFWRVPSPTCAAATDSFESWSGGLPVGWANAGGGGAIFESTTTGVTDGSKAVAFGGSSKAIQRSISIGNCGSLKFDYYANGFDTTVVYVTLNGSTVWSINPLGPAQSGTAVVSLSGFSGTATLDLSYSTTDGGGGAFFDNLRIEP